MRLYFLAAQFVLLLSYSAFSQEIIIRESFGSSSFNISPSSYPDYTSDALFSGSGTHDFTVVNSSGYEAASGGVAVVMGDWTADPQNVDFVLQYNTSAFINVQLAFGFHHWSSGWGTCQLTNNNIKIEYSTDSLNWLTIDKAQLINGSSWPCAETGEWSYIELAAILPSTENLYIRFVHIEPTTHPFHIDDITLSGYIPDNNPPSAPSGLEARILDYSSFILSWDAAEDDRGISSYTIYKNGQELLNTPDSAAKVEFQDPGSHAEFSVIAYDIGMNASPESEAVQVELPLRDNTEKYSWQDEQAKVLPSGKLEWTPRPFVFETGDEIRYINYEGGSDFNEGTSKETAWQHHPWDPNASGKAKDASGIDTYIFKRGVTYRGVLTAQESGTLLKPIRLTSDPSWGAGEARIYGSKLLQGSWKKADATIAPDIPDPENVWYLNVSLTDPKLICEKDGESFNEIRVARSPNFVEGLVDPIESWFSWTSKVESGGDVWLRDSKNMTQDNWRFYRGATVWSQEDAIVMCTVWKQDVLEWDPTLDRIRVDDVNFGGAGCHYFIENTPFLLDTVNEFYYDDSESRLFIRLENNRDPNTVKLEAAITNQLIKIDNKHDITISGLSFGMTTAHQVRYNQNDGISAIRITGICNNIEISNNTFEYLVGGVSLSNLGSRERNTSNIVVRDNDFQNISDLAINMASSTVAIDDVSILRNNIYNNGYRHQGRWYSSIPAIYGFLNDGEVAGNIVERTWGNGIDMFWGKLNNNTDEVPFIRGLIYQNHVSNSLIGTNDYGGIESWQGGPVYCYNNYSHNASGYKHFNGQSIGYEFYFDGAFKQIVFNNIASGISHQRNSAAFMQVLGYFNTYAHNTAFNTDKFFNAWKNNLAVCGHNTYLANLGQDVSKYFNYEISPENIPFDAYGNNISAGQLFRGALENLNDNIILSAFQSNLSAYKPHLDQVGYNASVDQIPNAGSGDFRLLAGGEASGKGVRFFTPFPLSRVVGEWNFYEHPADSSILMGENFYFTEDFQNRDYYKDVPKNHLTVQQVKDSSFTFGFLEDWTRGALIFDGSLYCSIEHSSASAVKSNNIDMDINDFIIELFFMVDKDHTGGRLLSKYMDGAGYELAVNELGSIDVLLYLDGAPRAVQSASTVLNDSSWHHLLVEVKRNAGINIYVDGLLDNSDFTGTMPDVDQSLTNAADLLIGNDQLDHFFQGKIDFLRISRGSLYDAKTTVNELYTWETDGPFLYDMKGRSAEGSRDAGALEEYQDCTFELREDPLEFQVKGGSHMIPASATDGLVIEEIGDDFYTLERVGDSLNIQVSENFSIDQQVALVKVYACGTKKQFSIIQAPAECYFSFQQDTLHLDYGPEFWRLPYETNGELTWNYDQETFFTASFFPFADSLDITIDENTYAESRQGILEIESCAGSQEVIVIQDAAPCVFLFESDSLYALQEATFLSFPIVNNGPLQLNYDTNSFFEAHLSLSGDSLYIELPANETTAPRIGQLTLTHCNGEQIIKLWQDALEGYPNQVNHKLAVYPNPSNNGVFQVSLSEYNGESTYMLSDLSGKVLQNERFFGRETEMKFARPAGTYILSIEAGENRYNTLIVIL